MSKEGAIAMITGETPTNPQPQIEVQQSDQVQAAPVEAPKDLDSARMASLARKEAEFVKRQQALKADHEKLLNDRKQVDEILKKRDLYEETRKKNPIDALKLIGFSEQDVFNFLAAQEQNKPSPEEIAAKKAEEAAKAQIDAFRKEQEEKEAKAIKERDNKLLQDFKTGLGGVIEANKDKYEYCAHYGEMAIDLAYRTVLQIVEDSNGEDIPTAEEAIQMIEELYEEQDKAMSTIKKRQPKTEAKVEAPETKTVERTRTVSTAPGSEPAKPTIQKTRTVSNDARITTRAAVDRKNETREQKRERLMQALRNGGL